ncbi:MAG TPA: EscU/YscU/HrcU family type III secretion system export apparatus switch protein [Rhizomicrobium sp.]|nr:EscU/YscU/HrcU family type III secretion system export apparatus switch protein [Rhizomicrobium sp.]
MAEGELDKSEQATPFKLQKAREKGTVARGMDLGFLAGVTTFLGYLWIEGSDTANIIASAAQRTIIGAATLADAPNAILSVVEPLFSSAFRPLFLMAAMVFAVVLLFELLQTGILFSAQPLKPDFSRLNPVTGLKRLFTVRMLIETAKNVLKVCVYVTVAYLVIRHTVASDTVHDAGSLLASIARAALRLLLSFAAVALLFAVLDQLIVRRDFLKKMAMSRREVRRETRDREGDPRLKQRRKQLHTEFSKMSQSLRNLKGADIVITNPDHIAIALRYDRRTMQAPRVVSLGTNRFAQYIKRMALLYGIPVMENRALARALYSPSALNRPIPEHCFQPVADIYNDLRAKAAAKGGEP